jgi:hypothetical protein
VGRIVHQDVEAAELADRSGDQRLAERRVADVAGDGHGLAALGADELDHVARVRLLHRQVADGDVGTLARVRDRRGAADAAVAAGDERAPAAEPPRTAVAGLAVIGWRDHLAGETRGRLGLPLERRLRIAGPRIPARGERRRRRGGGRSRRHRRRQRGGGDANGDAAEELAAGGLAVVVGVVHDGPALQNVYRRGTQRRQPPRGRGSLRERHSERVGAPRAARAYGECPRVYGARGARVAAVRARRRR